MAPCSTVVDQSFGLTKLFSNIFSRIKENIQRYVMFNSISCETNPKLWLKIKYRILSSIVRTFYIKNDAEIFPVHYTWKVAKKGFKIAFMMSKLAMIISFEIILEK